MNLQQQASFSDRGPVYHDHFSHVYNFSLMNVRCSNIRLSEPFSTAMVTSPTFLPRYDFAREQSFGFFYDITNEHWKQYQSILAEVEDHADPYDPHPWDDDKWQHYLNYYQHVS